MMRAFAAALLILTLGACGSDEVVQDVPWSARASALVQRGLSDPDPWVRAETVRIVGLSRDVLLLEGVRTALDDPHPLVQTSALETLIRMGSSSAEDAVLSALIRGSQDQKIRLLDLVFRRGSAGLQRNAVRRALRDVDPVIREATLTRMTERSVAVEPSEMQRLLADQNSDVVVAAFRNLARTRPDEAIDETLRRMRSDDSGTREQGLRFAVALGSPDVWAAMRSFLRLGNERERAIAALALGTIGDPLVEETLRQTVLSGDDLDAANALRALGKIPTERARQQAGRHRRDPRPSVRRAAFEVMRDLNYPNAEFEPHLEDPDPRVGAIVLDVLRSRDPQHAASVLARSLQGGSQPVNVLAALHRKSQREPIFDLIRAAQAQLEQLAGSADDDAAALAARLLLLDERGEVNVDRILRYERPGALLAVAEAALRAPRPEHSGLFARAMQEDAFFLQLAGAVGVLSLGDAWIPPAPPSPDAT